MRQDVFEAIADPTLRAILSLIALLAMTPNALAELAIWQGNLLLRKSQEDERNKWLAHFRAIWETRFNQLDTVLKNIKNKKS